ncbi:hypothetical protein D3C86_1445440 [compost metagenome]
MSQPQAQVVELDDARNQTINADSHDDGDTREHHHLLGQRRFGHDAEGDGDDFRREDEVGADRALDLVLLERHQVDCRIGHGFNQLRMFGLILGLAVQEFMGEFLETFETQVGAADHQQRRDQPRNERTDRQGGRHQDQLVDERALGYRPYHRDFPLGAYAADLLGVERQIVTEYAGRLLRCHFGHQRHIVEYRGDVVDQQQQTASCHESGFLLE